MSEPQFGERVVVPTVLPGWNRVALWGACAVTGALVCVLAIRLLVLTGRFGVIALAGDLSLILGPVGIILGVISLLPRWRKLRGLWVGWLSILVGLLVSVYAYWTLAPILVLGFLFTPQR